jgi:hypothetical protein
LPLAWPPWTAAAGARPKAVKLRLFFAKIHVLQKLIIVLQILKAIIGPHPTGGSHEKRIHRKHPDTP